MVKMLQSYVAKYGEANTWSLALKFQVLFEVCKGRAGNGTITNPMTEVVAKILSDLSKIENSGVVETKCELRDKQWEDSLYCEYRCGHMLIHFSRHNEYSLRSGVDTDSCLTVQYVK